MEENPYKYYTGSSCTPSNYNLFCPPLMAPKCESEPVVFPFAGK